MDIVTIIAAAAGLWLILAIAMAVAWAIDRRTGNSGWIDVSWTCAMGLAGLTSATAFFDLENMTLRQWIVAALVTIWTARLAGHIANRTLIISDDPRYRMLRETWGPAAPYKMFWLLQAQGALSVPMALTIALAAWNFSPFPQVLDFAALAIFVTGLTGSALSDWQLSRFKQNHNHEGRVCDSGLWAWSRHPNYFFEWLIWLSLALFAIDAQNVWSWNLAAFAGPAFMFWLLRFVSGVPPLEKHMLAKYGERYRRYQKTTSTFFPLPPASPATRAT